MSDEQRPSDDAQHEQHLHPARRDDVDYERSEAPFVGVAIVLVAIACMFALAGFVVRQFIRIDSHQLPLQPRPDSYVQSEETLPAQPRLEPLEIRPDSPPPHPLAQQLLMQQIRDSYGPGQDKQHVRVPIGVAIEVLSKQAATGKGELKQLSKSFGLVGGGEANSGRIYQEAPSWLQTHE